MDGKNSYLTLCDHQEHDVNNNGTISKKHQFQVFQSILVSTEEKRFRDIYHLQKTVHLRMILISQRSVIVLMVKSFRSGKCSIVLLTYFLYVGSRNLRYMNHHSSVSKAALGSIAYVDLLTIDAHVSSSSARSDGILRRSKCCFWII